MEDAAEQLHLTPSYVVHLVQGCGLGERRDGVWVADAEAVRARQRDREEWISFAGPPACSDARPPPSAATTPAPVTSSNAR